MLKTFDAWRSNMLTFGRKHADALIASQDDPTIDHPLGRTYYDAERVFYNIADYTGDPYWLTAAAAANHVYAGRYVIPNKGGLPGYWEFARGIAERIMRTDDPQSKIALQMLADNAAYAGDTTTPSWTRDASKSREVAYALESLLYEQNLLGTIRARIPFLVEQALGHASQWLAHTPIYTQPFMVGLTCEALVLYDQFFPGREAAIQPTIGKLCSLLWDECWLPDSQAFMYASQNVMTYSSSNLSVPGENFHRGPAPDLNMLIAPAFGWMFMRTNDEAYRSRGNLIFAGGVNGADLENPKQFNQSYRSSFDYIKWTNQLVQAPPTPIVVSARAPVPAVAVDRSASIKPV